MSNNPNPTTEHSILTSFLINPSPLTTILPYATFLTLTDAKLRNDPIHKSSLKHLYRDLQFQREILIDQVRDAIEREATIQSGTWKARIAKHIAIEEGEDEDEDQRPRKRRRRGVTNEEDEDGVSSSEDEFTNPVLVAAQQAMYHHPSSSHPAAHVLPVSGEALDRQLAVSSRSAYHTRASLLRELRLASRSLDEDIDGLEAECASSRSIIKETVGGLSDLRYGRRQSGGEEGSDAYKEVLEAIEQFREVIRATAKT